LNNYSGVSYNLADYSGILTSSEFVLEQAKCEADVSLSFPTRLFKPNVVEAKKWFAVRKNVGASSVNVDCLYTTASPSLQEQAQQAGSGPWVGALVVVVLAAGLFLALRVFRRSGRVGE
jgi:hypothetical protein